MAGWVTTARPEPDAEGWIWFELPCCGGCGRLASMSRDQWKTGEHATRYCIVHGMSYDVIPVPDEYLNSYAEFVLIVIAPEGVLPQ